MAVPDYQSLMLPLLTASTIGEVRIGDAVDRLAETFNLSSDERTQLLPSGKQTLFGNRVHWAKTYLTKAGLLESTRQGYFRITERGRRVIASCPPRIDNEFLSQFAEFQQFKAKLANDAAQDAPLELDRVYIQAKRYAAGNNIGAGAIRDFFGGLDRHKATKGLFVTTSAFSPPASETAEFLSKRIVLIDSERLSKLMIRYNVGCRVEEVLHIKKVDEDFIE